jgi:uncharacterized protein (DUF2336 family)
MITSLTRDDIGRFIEEDSWMARARVIERIAADYVDGALDAAGRDNAEEFFRLALYDGEPLVRRVMAETLKHATTLPRDIVLGLAQDVADVAAPFLAASPLLRDEDLLDIVAGGATVQRLAVAARRRLSSRVSDALTRYADPVLLNRLLANDDAAITETTLHAILNRAPDDDGDYQEAIARRRVLPVSVVGRLAAQYRRCSDAAEASSLLLFAAPHASG